MKLLSDRASVDELAQQSGALPETVEGRRHSALEGRTASLLNDGRTEREKAQKKEIRDLKEALSRATVGPPRSRSCHFRPWGRPGSEQWPFATVLSGAAGMAGDHAPRQAGARHTHS